MDEAHNPYRGPQAEVTGNADGDVPAGRGERLLATLLDAVLVLLLLGPLLLLGGYWQRALEAARAGQALPLSITLSWALVGFLVFAAVQGYPLAVSGQTWGKRALGLRMVDMAGRQPSFARLLGLRYGVRYALANVPLAGPLLHLANVLLIFRADRRCGHDLVAGTRVVKRG
ncbi:MAG: RDD family protein [Proteobacteria bacterium]|nr:RDD family protein [Pseudomonadota bacterium]